MFKKYTIFICIIVMQSAVANEFVLPNAMIRDILVANPQSAMSDPVLDELDDRVDPMPADLYNQILEGENVLAPLSAQKANIAALNANNSALYYQLATKYLSDSSQVAIDSLLYLFDARNTADAAYSKAFVQLNNGDYAAMQATLAGIPATFNLSPSDQLLHGYYQQFFDYMQQMQTDTLPGFEADSILIGQMTELMDNAPEPVKSLSRNILLANQIITYQEPYLYDDGSKSTSAKKHHRMGPVSGQVALQIFPNPADEFIIVQYNLDDELNIKPGKAALLVATATGQVIKKQMLQNTSGYIVLPTKTFVPGVYLIQLTRIEKKDEIKKITIIH